MTKDKGKTLTDYRSLHDRNVIVPARIQATLKAMEAEGRQNWAYEGDFVKRAGISQTDIGMFRERFAEHVVVTPALHNRAPKRVWFASKKAATAARG